MKNIIFFFSPEILPFSLAVLHSNMQTVANNYYLRETIINFMKLFLLLLLAFSSFSIFVLFTASKILTHSRAHAISSYIASIYCFYYFYCFCHAFSATKNCFLCCLTLGNSTSFAKPKSVRKKSRIKSQTFSDMYRLIWWALKLLLNTWVTFRWYFGNWNRLLNGEKTTLWKVFFFMKIDSYGKKNNAILLVWMSSADF